MNTPQQKMELSLGDESIIITKSEWFRRSSVQTLFLRLSQRYHNLNETIHNLPDWTHDYHRQALIQKRSDCHTICEILQDRIMEFDKGCDHCGHGADVSGICGFCSEGGESCI